MVAGAGLRPAGGKPTPPNHCAKKGAHGGNMVSPVKRASASAQAKAEKEGFEPSMEEFTPITP